MRTAFRGDGVAADTGWPSGQIRVMLQWRQRPSEHDVRRPGGAPLRGGPEVEGDRGARRIPDTGHSGLRTGRVSGEPPSHHPHHPRLQAGRRHLPSHMRLSCRPSRGRPIGAGRRLSGESPPVLPRYADPRRKSRLRMLLRRLHGSTPLPGGRRDSHRRCFGEEASDDGLPCLAVLRMAAVGQGLQGIRRQQDRQTQVAHGQLDCSAQRQDREGGGH